MGIGDSSEKANLHILLEIQSSLDNWNLSIFLDHLHLGDFSMAAKIDK